MYARVIAIALTLGISAAPIVTAVCEAVCAGRGHQDATAGEHHSCHHQSSTPAGIAIDSATHECGHADEGPSAVGPSLWNLSALAVVDVAFTLGLPSVEVRHHRTPADCKPPLISPRPTQLRI